MLAMPTDSTYIDESVVSTSAHTYEFHAMRKVNSATATSPGRASGRITCQNACMYDAPSIIAASSMSRGIERKKPISIHTENGSANDEYARISARYVLRRPRSDISRK